MQYEVVVPIPVRPIWDTFHDAERLAQCIPGLLLDEPARTGPDGPELTGRWKLRVGTNTVTYRGTLRLRDAGPAHALTVLVEGGEVRGSARVGAELAVTLYDERLSDEDDDATGETRMVIDATLRLDGAGRTAEFTPERLDAAFARAADLFAAALAEELAPAVEGDAVFEPVAAAPEETPTYLRPRVVPEPVRVSPDAPDLWSRVGAGRDSARAARRVARVLVPALGVLLVWRVVRGRRRRAG